MKSVLTALLALAVVAASGTETKVGAGVTLPDATPIPAIL
jgi:hypothetical protein